MNKITGNRDGQTKLPRAAAGPALFAPALSDSERGTTRQALLGYGDPPPATVVRAAASSPFVLVLDHAGRAIPHALGDLGLAEPDLSRHIAWDIGVAQVGAALSSLLVSPLVAQAYSRLVIDCNRQPGHATSIAARSDGTVIAGNGDLTEDERDARVGEIFEPYQNAIAALLDRRQAMSWPTVLVALHSFTPRLLTAARPDASGRDGVRPWHAGVLYNHDPRFSVILRDLLQAEGDLLVGDNEPYALSDLDDYTVPVHGERRCLPHVEIEIRQDLIADAAGQTAWATRLARLLPQAWDIYGARFG